MKNGSAVALEKELHSLHADASELLDCKFRSGKCDTSPPVHISKVRFGEIRPRGKLISAKATSMGRPWALLEYGDTIPGTRDGPTDDMFSEVITDRNQCLAIHLAPGNVLDWPQKLAVSSHAQVAMESTTIRWGPDQQSAECRGNTGVSIDQYQPVLVEMRAHAHDAVFPHHDRGSRSIIRLYPKVLSEHDVCAIRVSPSCSFATHVIHSLNTSSTRTCLLAHNGHMRLAVPDSQQGVAECARSPQYADQPTDWKSLLELCPHVVAIDTNCSSRCPHCQTQGARLPMGIEGLLSEGLQS